MSVAEMLLKSGAEVNLANKVTCGGKCQLLMDWVVNYSEYTETSVYMYVYMYVYLFICIYICMCA